MVKGKIYAYPVDLDVLFRPVLLYLGDIHLVVRRVVLLPITFLILHREIHARHEEQHSGGEPASREDRPRNVVSKNGTDPGVSVSRPTRDIA